MSEKKLKRPLGVALLAVLTVLTVLSLLAATFAAMMTMEEQAGSISLNRSQSDMLAQSAIEHVYGLLRQDSIDSPEYDGYDEIWSQTFKPRQGEERVNVEGDKGGDYAWARWIYVRDNSGRPVGRYAVLVEDEHAKINLHTATALGTRQQNEGFGTFEVMLTDGEKRGLPLTMDAGKRLLKYRYGRDERPGQANVDDNLTVTQYGSDSIDNNANGRYDEDGEGVDEPEEYDPNHLVWDDMAFQSLREALAVALGGEPTSLSQVNAFKHLATLWNTSQELYYEKSAKALRRSLDINHAELKQLRRALRNANNESPFEPSSSRMRSLLVNLLDYTDENHTLTTVDSTYGVESVCFNEIMAHDGSWIRETDWCGWGFPSQAGSGASVPEHVLSANQFYGHRYKDLNNTFRWRFGNVRKRGNDWEVKLEKPRRQPPRFDEFINSEVKGWYQDQWKGATCIVYNAKSDSKGFYISQSQGGKGRELTIKGYTEGNKFMEEVSSNLVNATVKLYSSWTHDGAMWCDDPLQTEIFYFRPLHRKQEKYYYRVYNASQAFIPSIGYGKSNVREMDLDGIPARYSVQQEEKDKKNHYLLKYPYKEGKAQKPNKEGYIEVVVTSSKKCRHSGSGRRGKTLNYSDAMYFIRPDIVELVNISSYPISLRNWQVVVNTGLEAELLATVDKADHYSKARSGFYEDPNPIIEPNGYFYLTNNREIFDIEYCGGNGNYGRSQKTVIPVFELPDEDWGILYDVTKVKGDYITVSGANWHHDQLEGELIEFVSDRTPTAKADIPNGMIKYVYGNNSNRLDLNGSDPAGSGLQVGDKIRVRGLPRQGGFVSFTLKNEYGQVAARTTEYGSVEEEEFGYSTEKDDPAHYTWKKHSRPTFGGNTREAESRRMRTQTKNNQTHIKNAGMANISEVQKIKTGDDWENVGGGSRSDSKTIKAVGKYFTTAGIRLDAEEEGVHLSGWAPAFGTVASANGDVMSIEGVNWEPDTWKGHTLRVMTGAQREEKIPIVSSSRTGITVDGLTAPSELQLKLKKGDVVSVGPGYATPFYYATKDGDVGEWEWRDKGLEKADYGLYIFGLNDAIDTTEFLEENHNAEMEVFIYNYETGEYDALPLNSDELRNAADDPYLVGSNRKRIRYDKNDRAYCGIIHGCHISAKGGIKVKIIPHNLSGVDSSGKAWLDYVYLAPGPTAGRININTAEERILTSLKGITPALARNIAKGIDNYGNASLKPYKNATDLLNVKGFTPEIFGPIANLITTRSDQFRVRVITQTITKLSKDDNFNENDGDKITSQSAMDMIVDRSDALGENGANFRIISREFE
ncbi:helix-hairpin-helix domain-containing protein [bacterium]|nr:helix-hairpin-helix domain-containing protein [bacterium]